jgi:predicted transposase/invertase (TIGR01784 family)
MALLLKDEVFSSAFEMAKWSNLDQNGREQYEYSLKVIRDNFATMQSAMREAKEEGKLEGKLEAKLEVARSSKAAGLSLEQIQAITGLSAEELEQNGIS